MRWNSWTIRDWILASFALVVVPVLILAGILAHSLIARERNLAEDRAMRAARLVAGSINDNLATANSTLLVAGQGLRMSTNGYELNSNLLQSISSELPPFVRGMVAWDSSGTLVGRTSGDTTAGTLPRWSDSAVQRALRSGAWTIGDGTRSLSGDWTVTAARGVLRQGRITGVVALSILPERLGPLLQGRGLPTGTVATLLGSNGAVLSRSMERERWLGYSMSSRPRYRQAQMQQEGAAELVAADSVLRLSAWVHTRQAPWMVYIGIPSQVAFARLRDLLGQMAAFGILVTVLAIGLAWTSASRIANPLRALAADTGKVGGGDLSHRSTVNAPSEVGALANAFNHMTATLERRTGILKENEERYRLIFEHNPLPMWVYDLESLEFLAVNLAAIKHYGYSREEFLAMTLRDIRPPEDVPVLQETIGSMQQGFADARVFRHRSKDGAILDVEITSHDIAFGGRNARLVLAHDVTRRLQLEATLRQAQKMEAVGQLAGGIAHDFNNLLTVISSYSQFLRDSLPADDSRVADVEEIRGAAARAADLTRQLLAFSRKQVLQPRLVDLDDIVSQSGKMLRRVISEDIELVTVLSSRPALVRVDRGQIEQVLLNLAVNARDSMPNGGCLTIAVSHEQTTDDEQEQVMLTVMDTGVGMDADTQERIFEPFFTTKPPGQGTGLGLSTVYGIVQQSEGEIRVESKPGGGSKFTVLLPAVPSARQREAPTRSRPLEDSGTETILVVEDEPAVRSLAQRALEARGYTVLTAKNGEEALKQAEEHAGSIDLVLTDLIMPRMGGRELAARLAEAHSSSRVLFTSGYAGKSGPQDLDGFVPGAPFLPKPFTPSELARRVRAVLDGTDI